MLNSAVNKQYAKKILPFFISQIQEKLSPYTWFTEDVLEDKTRNLVTFKNIKTKTEQL